MDLLAGLNNSQREAVRHAEGPLLVLAGAGSGKTRVLTTRIAYLLKERKVSPYNILAITFTNKAAGEMKERVAAFVPEVARDLWIGTFHATCVRILRKQARFCGYHENFVIYDDNDQQTLLKECLRELNLDEKKYSPRSLAAVISRAKNELTGPEKYAEEARNLFARTAAKVYTLYQEKLAKNCALDFDDLIMLTVRLFQENEPVLAYYQNKFRYILVDEYQDTNHAQYVLVKLLGEAHRNVFVVGDPDQSIYGWRGASIRNILEFEKDYPDARIIKLEQNYRSTQTILDAANQVIRHNRARKEKRLWTAAGKGAPVVVYLGDNEHLEAEFVADRIARLRREAGFKYSDFAVLYRTHAMSRVVEEVFLHRGIPYTMVGGLKFYERKEIKDLLAYLRLLANPADVLSLARIINVPRRGIGEASWQKITAFAAAENIPVRQALARAEKIPDLATKAKKACVELAGIFDRLEANLEHFSITEIANQVLEQTGYWRELVVENTVESRTRQENLKEFLSVTQEFDREDEERTLGAFLAKMALYSDVDRYDHKADQVVLMTLHSAKGLEFPVVFLIGMEEGVFPHSRSLFDQGELEEERRLCYVGITRARQRLYLTRCWQRTLYGATRVNVPSRFLEEIPDDLLTPDDPLDRPGPETKASGKKKSGKGQIAPLAKRLPATKETKGDLPAEAAGGGGRAAAPSSRAFAYRPGDRVRHDRWGAGTVVAVRGEGEAAEIKVAFPERGVKTLLARYAPLQRE
ncbi:MAG: DNA helicase PcrA [Armatimonadetes bacterium]|nr:DNA helicase PcrA [Armatimonadota bacterium]